MLTANLGFAIERMMPADCLACEQFCWDMICRNRHPDVAQMVCMTLVAAMKWPEAVKAFSVPTIMEVSGSQPDVVKCIASAVWRMVRACDGKPMQEMLCV